MEAPAQKAQHNQSMEKVIQNLKAAARQSSINTMEGMEYVDRGDYYEVVVKGPLITKYGRFGVVFTESQLKDAIVLSGVPPITVTYSKKMARDVTVQGLKDLGAHVMKQVVQTIREAPKEIHASYRKAYFKAKEEYKERVKNKPAGQVDDPDEMDEETENSEQIIRDEQLRLAKIMGDQIIRAEQMRAEQIRASYRKAYLKGVRNQTGQVDAHDVDPTTVLSVKRTFEEAPEIRASDVEKHLSSRQGLAKLKAEQFITAAHVKADRLIRYDKVIRASKREKYERCVRNPGAWQVDIEAMLGFKDNPIALAAAVARLKTTDDEDIFQS